MAACRSKMYFMKQDSFFPIFSTKMSTASESRWWRNSLWASLQIWVYTWRDVEGPVWRELLGRIPKQHLSRNRVPRRWNVECWPNMQGYDQWMRPSSPLLCVCMCVCESVLISVFVSCSRVLLHQRKTHWSWILESTARTSLSGRYSTLWVQTGPREQGWTQCGNLYQRWVESRSIMSRYCEVNLCITPVAGTNFDIICIMLHHVNLLVCHLSV